MKTADLIPFILLELNECDKYGFELTKAIETKSNRNIIIKQPTLYTLLKKLEKSKFITSYWQDSEIGGKRHYYKLTQNGRLQASTFPSYAVLMHNILEETASDADDATQEISSEAPVAEKEFMNSFYEQTTTPSETILPTSEVFSTNTIDTSTELEVNASNAEFLKENGVVIEEQFATNDDVSKFTEKVTTQNIQQIASAETNCQQEKLLDIKYTIPTNDIDIKYVDYVNFKNTPEYKYSKKITSKLFVQSLLTSVALITILLLCGILSSFSGRSGLYYIFFILGILISLFHPILIAVNRDKIRLTYQSKTYSTKTKLRSYIGLSIILAILLICIVVNIKIGNNSIAIILGFSNFENLYAPLLITSVYFVDLALKHMFLSKINK